MGLRGGAARSSALSVSCPKRCDAHRGSRFLSDRLGADREMMSSPRPGSVRENRSDHEMHERRKQTRCWMVHAGSRLKLAAFWEGTAPTSLSSAPTSFGEKTANTTSPTALRLRVCIGLCPRATATSHLEHRRRSPPRPRCHLCVGGTLYSGCGSCELE